MTTKTTEFECRRCGNDVWRTIPPLPAVFVPRPAWRDKYGSICDGGLRHSPRRKEEVSA